MYYIQNSLILFIYIKTINIFHRIINKNQILIKFIIYFYFQILYFLMIIINNI